MSPVHNTYYKQADQNKFLPPPLAMPEPSHGYAIQCLSQARINWEGCGRKGIRRKNRGVMEVGR